ncbi:cytochrome c oxidase subunit III domain-containing protein [Haematococcus lacustris]
MSRAMAIMRALQRLPAAAFPEATMVARAALSCGTLSNVTNDVQGAYKGFSAGIRPQMPSLSFASQMHSLTRKDDEQSRTQPLLAEVPKAASVLSLLPPRPGSSAAARRGMATAEGHGHGLEMGQTHPYHILPASPWPLLASSGALMMMTGMAGWFHAIPHCGAIMFGGLGATAMTAIAWWRDCYIESDYGMHTEIVKRNLISGVWIFIVSEAALFFGLLWSCVHLGMSPNVWIQMQWPPVGIDAIGWEGRALVMSAVLAASYYSANVAMVAKDPKVVMAALGTTVGLGALFLADQYLEYSTAPFTLTDGPYGTTFFVTTGFHGFHVLLGSLWLAASMANYARYNKPTVSMKGAVLYWHFVDIVWIAVYGIIYAAQL